MLHLFYEVFRQCLGLCQLQQLRQLRLPNVHIKDRPTCLIDFVEPVRQEFFDAIVLQYVGFEKLVYLLGDSPFDVLFKVLKSLFLLKIA